MRDPLNSFDFNKRDYYPILPLVYDDALSYIETLGKISTKLNEVIDHVNSATSDAVEQAKQYTDSQIEAQREFVLKAVEDVNELAREIEKTNAEFVETVNARLTLTDNKVGNLEKNIVASIEAVNKRTDNAIEQNNIYLIEHMDKYLGNIRVLNFFTGERIGVQEMFDYLSMLHTTDSIIVSTLASRAKTVNTLVALNLTMTDIVMHGNTLII